MTVDTDSVNVDNDSRLTTSSCCVITVSVVISNDSASHNIIKHIIGLLTSQRSVLNTDRNRPVYSLRISTLLSATFQLKQKHMEVIPHLLHPTCYVLDVWSRNSPVRCPPPTKQCVLRDVKMTLTFLQIYRYTKTFGKLVVVHRIEHSQRDASAVSDRHLKSTIHQKYWRLIYCIDVCDVHLCDKRTSVMSSSFCRLFTCWVNVRYSQKYLDLHNCNTKWPPEACARCLDAEQCWNLKGMWRRV